MGNAISLHYSENAFTSKLSIHKGLLLSPFPKRVFKESNAARKLYLAISPSSEKISIT